MAEYRGPCADGEDLMFLAHCAEAGDFSLLVDGYIQPKYLSPAGREVAEWILEQYQHGRDTGTDLMPSYDVLGEMFPDLPWPELPRDSKGLDPRFAATEIWYSYKNHVGFVIHGHTQSLVEMSYSDDLYLTRVQAIRELAEELQYLQQPAGRPIRFGEDPMELFNTIIGAGGDEQIGGFEADMPELEALFAPYTSGGYFFFGRPKRSKSWRIYRMAWYHSILRGQTAVLCDPENGKEVTARRLACLHGGIDYGFIKDLVIKWQRKEAVLTRAEKDLIDELHDLAFDIQQRSRLVIVGKEAIDPETRRIEVEHIFSEADRVGTSVLFLEQVHKYGAPGLPKNAADTARIHRVVPVLADSKYLTFGTTQEKRKDNPKRFTMPTPHEDWVFGGDAVAQNCKALVHIDRFEVNDGSIIIMLTPLLGRDGEPGTVDQSIFVRARFGTTYETLPHAQGLAMCNALLMEQRQIHADAEAAARDIMGNGEHRGEREPRPPRPAGSRAVASWLKRG